MSEPTLESITDKLKEIYDDLADNVTFIYGRQDLHLLMDLVYHSPLKFKYDGKIVKKGYPEVLVVGDTRSGKTQCAESLQNHYGVGVMAGGECTTFAGLVGGCQQLGKHWNITWGVLPQQNRRLVILDEAGGMKEEVIAQMSSVRSQGIAEITKIQTQKTEAKTRMIWMANPRDSMTVNQFAYGIDAVESLVSFPEDIARWDAIMIVSKDEIKFSDMATRGRPRVSHVHTAELCHDLVLWSWCREVDEVELTSGAEDACYELGERMCQKYCSDFTVVNDSEIRIKLARLATALAARLYSTPDGKKLVVHRNHVRYMYDFLNRTYDSPYFKYNIWSINRMKGFKLLNRDEVENFCKMAGAGRCGKFGDLRTLRCKDIEEFMGCGLEEAKVMLSQLITNNALRRSRGDYYYKSPDFNTLLAQYSQSGYEPDKKEF